MVIAGLNTDEAEAVWKPFLDFVAASPDDFAFTDEFDLGTTNARHWWDAELAQGRTLPRSWWSTRVRARRPATSGGPATRSRCNAFIYGYESLWLPASLLRDPGRLADALFEASRHYDVQLHFNKGLGGAPADKVEAARDTPVNPAVLDAFALAIIATGAPHSNPGVPGHEPDLVKGKADAAAITAAADRLRAVVPDAGAYSNESNYHDRSFQKSYWGSNYPRLARIKKKYDPEGLFFVHNGVGSEEWDKAGFERVKPS